VSPVAYLLDVRAATPTGWVMLATGSVPVAEVAYSSRKSRVQRPRPAWPATSAYEHHYLSATSLRRYSRLLRDGARRPQSQSRPKLP